jgi:hypothetical protein
MSRVFGPVWAIVLCSGLAACGGGGGGGGGEQATAAAPSFRSLGVPTGFAPATASIKTVNVMPDAVMAGGGMPAGYADPLVYTWVTFSYLDATGVARTLAVVRWTAFAQLGAQGLRIDLPSEAAGLRFAVYNVNGAKSGSVSP